MVGMETNANITLPYAEIADFCQRWHICEFALFGSVLRADFSPESDIDVLVLFDPDFQYGIADLMAMEAQLEALFGRRVDLVNKRMIEKSPNYIRRNAILRSAQVIYAAR